MGNEVLNKRVKALPLKVGDLVLKKTWQKPNKLHPNWHGPYRVVKEVVSGMYRLENLERDPFSNRGNVDHLKKYYQ